MARAGNRSPSMPRASSAMISGAEQMATRAETAIPARGTAAKEDTWYPAMQMPIATAKVRQPRGSRGARVARLAATRRTAAMDVRAAPTSRGLALARSARMVLTDPVVPQDAAAMLTSSRPRTDGDLDGLDTARDDSPRTTSTDRSAPLAERICT